MEYLLKKTKDTVENYLEFLNITTRMSIDGRRKKYPPMKQTQQMKLLHFCELCIFMRRQKTSNL